MSWVSFIIAVGLIGVLVEMLLAYLKEASEITEEQLHNRQQIQAAYYRANGSGCATSIAD